MSQSYAPNTMKLLPGSISLQVESKSELDVSCRSYLQDLGIEPDSFANKVKSYFRLATFESWRASGERTTRESVSSTERICKELELTNKAYASRLLGKLSMNHLLLLSLRWNIPLDRIFRTAPQGIAIEASTSTFNAIKQAIFNQQAPPQGKGKWQTALSSLSDSKNSSTEIQSIKDGDYCLLFRLLMDPEWAGQESRSKASVERVARRIIQEHREQDLKHVAVSQIETLQDTLALLRDGTEYWYLLMWSRPLAMEFKHD